VCLKLVTTEYDKLLPTQDYSCPAAPGATALLISQEGQCFSPEAISQAELHEVELMIWVDGVGSHINAVMTGY
jgi:hypothetical protein